MGNRSVLGGEKVPGLVASTAAAVVWVLLQSFGIVLVSLWVPGTFFQLLSDMGSNRLL